MRINERLVVAGCAVSDLDDVLDDSQGLDAWLRRHSAARLEEAVPGPASESASSHLAPPRPSTMLENTDRHELRSAPLRVNHPDFIDVLLVSDVTSASLRVTS